MNREELRQGQKEMDAEFSSIINPNPKGESVMTKEELEKKSLKELVAIYNEKTGKSIKVFSDKETAVKRILAVGSPSEMIRCEQKGGQDIPRAGCRTRQEDPKRAKDCPRSCKHYDPAKHPTASGKRRSAGGPPRETKFGKLRAALNQKKEWSPADLEKISGFDPRNLRTALAILRNPKRSKEVIITKLDRENEVYLVVSR